MIETVDILMDMIGTGDLVIDTVETVDLMIDMKVFLKVTKDTMNLREDLMTDMLEDATYFKKEVKHFTLEVIFIRAGVEDAGKITGGLVGHRRITGLIHITGIIRTTLQTTRVNCPGGIGAASPTDVVTGTDITVAQVTTRLMNGVAIALDTHPLITDRGIIDLV